MSELPTVVLVHGAGSAGSVWAQVQQELAGRCQTLAPDLPGHGQAAKPGRDRIDGYASWLEAFVASRTDEAVVLAGHSMGGAIVLQAALKQRVELAGLVLIATGARLKVAPQLLDGLQADFEGTMERLAEYAYGPSAPIELKREGQARLLQAGQEVVYHDFAACDAFDATSQLRRIELPTLVVCGSLDRMTPPSYGQLLVQQLPNASLAVLDGRGHMLPVEAPAELATAIGGFLDELEA